MYDLLIQFKQAIYLCKFVKVFNIFYFIGLYIFIIVSSYLLFFSCVCYNISFFIMYFLTCAFSFSLSQCVYGFINFLIFFKKSTLCFLNCFFVCFNFIEFSSQFNYFLPSTLCWCWCVFLSLGFCDVMLGHLFVDFFYY